MAGDRANGPREPLIAAIASLVLLLAGDRPAPGADCNRNEIEDAEEVALDPALDCNGNGVPDSCDLDSLADFPEMVEFPTGPRPIAVFSGDLDGDGDLDLVTSSNFHRPGQSEHLVNVLLNTGPARFEESTDYSVAYEPGLPASGDFDGDAWPDLAVPHSHFDSDAVTLLINQGGGRFAPARRVPVARGENVLTAGDFDADGDPDIVVAIARTRTLTLLRNDGRATFEATGVPLPKDPVVIASADLDADQDLDVLVGNARLVQGSGDVSLYLNDGNGALQASGTLLVGAGPTAIAPADLDGDLDIDVAVTNSDSADVTVLFNDGAAGFGGRLTLIAGSRPYSIASGDLDGDGDLDLLAGDASNHNVTFFRNTSGSFVRAADYAMRSPLYTFAVGDFDADLDLDLATGYLGGTVSITLNLGGGTLSAAANVSLGLGFHGMVEGDLDGNGLLDLAVLSSVPGTVRGRLSVILNSGMGFASPVDHFTSTFPSMLLAADLNGDSRLDLVTAHPDGGQLSIFRNRGGGLLATPLTMPVGSNPLFVSDGDFDGDGDVDLAVVKPPVSGVITTISVLENNGQGGFSPGAEAQVGPEPGRPASGDLEGDGDVDLVVPGGRTRSLWVLRNRGDGSFDAAEELRVGSGAAAARVGDLDGDGRLDLAVLNRESADVSVLLNEGGGAFGSATSLAIGPGAKTLAAADIDGDGDIDLASANEGSDDVSLLLNPGDGVFHPQVRLGVGRQPIAIVAGDFTGNGGVDLATANQSGGDISILENRLTPAFSSDCNRNGVPDECDLSSRVSADANGDAIPDECERRPFHRGDPSGDGVVNITDSLVVFGFLFLGLQAPECMESADANNDGSVTITDGIYLLRFLFLGGAPLPAPGPPGEPCGLDSDAPDGAGDLGCEVYAQC